MKKTTQVEKVVAVRARQREGEKSEKLFFLFTTNQVEGVLSNLAVRPLPFAPSFLQGLSCWRESLLPVLDLEKCFFIESNEQTGKSRFVVVRAGTMESPAGGEVFRCILELSDEIHSIDISASNFVAVKEYIGIEPSLLRGIYRWNENIYVVPDLVSILQKQSGVES